MPTILEETRFILNKYNIKADKKLGQNFLISDDAVNRIIEKSEVTKSDLVIEIGPGLGTLTKELLERAGKVICIELDTRMVKILNERFSLYDNFEIIHDDILKVDLKSIIKREKENQNMKEAKIVANVETPSIKDLYESIKDQYQEVFISSETALAQVDSGTLIIVVDTHKKTYVESPELLTKTNKIVIIDHHRRSADFIDNSILTFQEVYASSAAELVTEIIQYTQNEVELSEVEAEALYAGIMMDTKNFTFKTGVRTFEAAAYLRRCGVDIIKVKKWFQSDLESYNTISEIVRKAEIVRDSIGISIYDVQEKETSLICAKAADELLTIGNITASFVLGLMEDGKVCISGRSIGDVNVQMILEKLGGGGHITLAGAQLENVTIDEAKQELISKINEYFEEKE